MDASYREPAEFGFEFVIFRAERGAFPTTWASPPGHHRRDRSALLTMPSGPRSAMRRPLTARKRGRTDRLRPRADRVRSQTVLTTAPSAVADGGL